MKFFSPINKKYAYLFLNWLKVAKKGWHPWFKFQPYLCLVQYNLSIIYIISALYSHSQASTRPSTIDRPGPHGLLPTRHLAAPVCITAHSLLEVLFISVAAVIWTNAHSLLELFISAIERRSRRILGNRKNWDFPWVTPPPYPFDTGRTKNFSLFYTH